MSKFADALRISRAQSREPQRVNVPEWEGIEDGVVFFAYPQTLADQEKIDALAGDSSGKRMVYTVIEKLLDADGEKVFDIGDVGALLNEPSNAVINAYLGILKVGEPSSEDHAKN